MTTTLVPAPRLIDRAAPDALDGSAADRPRPLSPAELARAVTPGAVPQGPSRRPPGVTNAENTSADAAVWLTGKKVLALWANRSARNAHAYLDGSGWLRLADSNDSAHSSLTMLASAAHQTAAPVDTRVESNSVREIYYW